jgi:hypothetical protein
MGVVLIGLEELLSNFCFLVLRCDLSLQTSTTSISSILPDPHLQALWSSSDSSLDLFLSMRFNLFSRSLILSLVAAEKSCASYCLHWTYRLIFPTSVRIVHMTLIGVVGVRLARYTLHRVHSVYYPSCGYLHHDSGSCAILPIGLIS